MLDPKIHPCRDLFPQPLLPLLTRKCLLKRLRHTLNLIHNFLLKVPKLSHANPRYMLEAHLVSAEVPYVISQQNHSKYANHKDLDSPWRQLLVEPVKLVIRWRIEISE